jgi:oligopeptide/dipeptide ABC transporter ATP-binding protein
LPRLDASKREKLTPIKGSPPSLVNLPAGCPFSARCPMSQPVCNQQEPDLLATDSSDHYAACHFSDQLVGTSPAELFETTAAEAAVPAAEMVEGADHGK